MEVIRAHSDQTDTLGALTIDVVYEVYTAEEECPMRAERTENVDQVIILDGIAGFPGLTKDVMTASITREGHNGFWRTDNRLECMLQGLVN